MQVSEEQVFSCCASRRFAKAVASKGPYANIEALLAAAREAWWTHTDVPGWLEAFAAHPKIGEKKAAVEASAQFSAFSHSEQQAAASTTTDAVAAEMADLNAKYYDRYGFIFIICARGRPAPEILSELKRRFGRPAHEELQAAAHEQMQITELRLRALLQQPAAEAQQAARRAGALLSHLTAPLMAAQQQQQQESASTSIGSLSAAPPPPAATLPLHNNGAPRPMSLSLAARAPVDDACTSPCQLQAAPTAGPAAPGLRSPITTHVLDTALGVPACGLPLSLTKLQEGGSGVWATVGRGVTNEDGRVGTLMAPGHIMPAGRYRMTFDTATYLQLVAKSHPGLMTDPPFYPEVVVEFVVPPNRTTDHYHIPLLLSPYGYSTYKGS